MSSARAQAEQVSPKKVSNGDDDDDDVWKDQVPEIATPFPSFVKTTNLRYFLVTLML